MARKGTQHSRDANLFVPTDDEGAEKETIAAGEKITDPSTPR